MTTSTSDARRVTIYRHGFGWRYRVQRANWSTLAAGQLTARSGRAAAERRAARKWPGVEIVVDDTETP